MHRACDARVSRVATTDSQPVPMTLGLPADGGPPSDGTDPVFVKVCVTPPPLLPATTLKCWSKVLMAWARCALDMLGGRLAANLALIAASACFGMGTTGTCADGSGARRAGPDYADEEAHGGTADA